MPQIEIDCPQCTAHYSLGAEMLGTKVQCAECDVKFYIYEDGSVGLVPKEVDAAPDSSNAQNQKEDERTLREFFPDAQARSNAHRLFAHQFLPPYVHQNPYAFFHGVFGPDLPGDGTGPLRFIQARWMMFEEIFRVNQRSPLERVIFRRVADLAISAHEAAGRPVALVTMPAPEQPTEAFFVAIVLMESSMDLKRWSRDALARYFTLERSDVSPASAEGSVGLFCEWTKDGRRLNSGKSIPAEPGKFLEAVKAALQAGGGSRNAPSPLPKPPDLRAVPQTRQPLGSVVTTLGKETIAPFILSHVPSYNPTEAQRLWEPFQSPSADVKTTIRSPNHGVYIVISKVKASPTTRGIALSLNGSGWIAVPPEFMARLIKPNKPVSARFQASLNQFYRILSSKLYARGDCCGLLQFENGNGMRIDIKEDPKCLEALIFKATFMPHKSYSAKEFEPDMVFAWRESASVQTVSHGAKRSDGWSTFAIPLCME